MLGVSDTRGNEITERETSNYLNNLVCYSAPKISSVGDIQRQVEMEVQEIIERGDRIDKVAIVEES